MAQYEQTSLDVSEVFRSIQGESTAAGLPCVFIRLSGCNLRCRYCDTRYAYQGGVRRTVRDLVREAESLGGELVEVTGGEPLMQPGTPVLLEALQEHFRLVLVETNGSLPLPRNRTFRAILDLKSPSSGETEHMDWTNIERLCDDDEVKFVVADRNDFDWALAAIDEHALLKTGAGLLVSPVSSALDPAVLATWILDCGLPLRLQLQLHKILWPNIERGV